MHTCTQIYILMYSHSNALTHMHTVTLHTW